MHFFIMGINTSEGSRLAPNCFQITVVPRKSTLFEKIEDNIGKIALSLGVLGGFAYDMLTYDSKPLQTIVWEEMGGRVIRAYDGEKELAYGVDSNLDGRLDMFVITDKGHERFDRPSKAFEYLETKYRGKY